MQQPNATTPMAPEQPATPRVCSTCGHEFVPAPRQSKKFCISCRWRAWNATIHTCLHPDCTEKLRSDNTTGYCGKHRGHHKLSATDEMVGLYKEGGLGVDEVSERLHINRNIVARVIEDSGEMRTVGQGISLIKRGRPSPKSFDKWKAIELRHAGKSTKEIAQQLNRRSRGNIVAGFESMGWPLKQYHSFGEPFERAALQRLYKMSGFLSVSEMAQKLGMPSPTLAQQVSTTRIPGQELDFDTARKVAQWREILFFRLMSKAPANPTSGHEWGQSSIVLAFFPKLRDRYTFLLKVLQRLAPTLRENPKWKRHDLEQHLCNQAMLEEAGRSQGDLFRQFLPWAPALVEFLAKKLEDIRCAQHGPLALEIIARWLKTTEAIVTNVMYPSQANQIRKISSRDMHELILSQNGVAQQQQTELEAANAAARAEVDRLAEEVERLQPKDPGRPSGPEEETRRQMRLIAAFLKCEWSLRKMSPFICPDKPSQSRYGNTRAVKSAYQDEIYELRDRMTMNEAEALIQEALIQPYTPPAEKIA